MERPEVIDIGPAPAALEAEAQLGDVFVRSYRRLVVRLYGVAGDLGEAEDLVQEAFVRAAAAGTRFIRVRNHEAWLRTVGDPSSPQPLAQAGHLHAGAVRPGRDA